MKNLCKHCPVAFTPYVHEALQETFRILDTPDEDVKKAGLEAITEFIIAYHNMGTDASREVFHTSVSHFIPRYVQLIAGFILTEQDLHEKVTDFFVHIFLTEHDLNQITKAY